MKARMGSARCCCGESINCDKAFYLDEFDELNSNWDVNLTGFGNQLDNILLSGGMLRLLNGTGRLLRCVLTYYRQRVWEYRLKGRMTRDAPAGGLSTHPYGYSCSSELTSFKDVTRLGLDIPFVVHSIVGGGSILLLPDLQHNLRISYWLPTGDYLTPGPRIDLDLIVGDGVHSDPEPFDFGFKLTDNNPTIPGDLEIRWDFKLEIFWGGDLVYTVPHVHFLPHRRGEREIKQDIAVGGSYRTLVHGFWVKQWQDSFFTVGSKVDIDEFLYAAE